MKLFFFSMLLFVSSNFTIAQIDSVNFTAQFVSNPSFSAGLDSLSSTGDVLQVNVYMNDFSVLGAATVLIYDAATDTPLAIVKRTRNEILSGQFTNNGLLVFNFPFLEVNGSYKIVLETQNFQMAYFEPFIKYLPSN